MENIKMTEWKVIKLGDVADIIGGGTPDTKNDSYWGGDVPWLTPKDLSGYGSRHISKGERNISYQGLTNSSAKMLPAGSVLLTSRAPIGYVAIAKNQLCTNQGFKSLVLKENADSEFFYYLLKNNVDYIQGMSSGSTFAEISGSQVKALEFKIPSLDVQKRIAGILGALDDRIDVLRRENVVLEQMAQAVFQSWFVDFDIVRAKAAGTPESEVCEKYHISPELYALFPSALTPDNLPLGWEKKKLGDISQYSKEKTTNVNIETYVSTENMLPNYGGIEKASSVPETGQSTRYKAGNVLISNIRPYFKKIWFADREGSCSNDVLVFSSNGIGKCMLYSILAQDVFFDFVMSGANGDKMPRGNKKHIMTYPVIFPNMDLLNKFENLVASLFDKKSKNAQQIRALSTTRDALLPKLMNGEIEV